MTFRTAALTLAAALLLPQGALAQGGQSTIIVEQPNTPHLGSWGLATPTGVIEGSSQRFTTQKPSGSFVLTVTPPAGAISRIDVFRNDVLVKSFAERTASANVSSGEILRFTIEYDFVLLGTVIVTSNPPGLLATVRGPRGTEDVTTPFTDENAPEGTYQVTYRLRAPCRPIAPIARNLRAKDRVHFHYDSTCPSLPRVGGTTPKPTPERPAPPPTRVPAPPSPTPTPAPRRRAAQSPVRLSLSTASREVTAGAATRFTLRLLNRSDRTLRNLAVEVRFDPGQLSLERVGEGNIQGGTASWTVALLPAGGTFEQTFVGNTAERLENGTTIIASASVGGPDLAGARAADRSASARISVLKALPKTGVPLDALYLLTTLAMSGMAAGVGSVLRRKKS